MRKQETDSLLSGVNILPRGLEISLPWGVVSVSQN